MTFISSITFLFGLIFSWAIIFFISAAASTPTSE
ncbi:uncharacterized protein METZ01_LOCUS98214 [marine metagenome]|uniref:Uncharacterized protein n=1 Tax=marine metagenome TaxID=408172 RepID=A0A381VYJ1_9ZZZZ